MIKTALSQISYQLRLSWWERLEHTKFLLIMLLIFFGFQKKRIGSTNSFFNLWDLPRFGKSIQNALFFDSKMTRCLLDPKHKGMRAWEYGLFLTEVSLRRGMHILDIGSGSSALPFYLNDLGMKITAFDLKHPLEQSNTDLMKRFPNLAYDRGSMLDLPYSDETFDLILCITAIEHLDYDFERKKALPYNLFLKRTKKALSEMVRVLKPSGRFFLTSDLYFPKHQKTDRYSHSFLYTSRIGAAFKREDFENVFIETLKRRNCRLIGKTDFDFERIFTDINRANFRGRYFTTFALYAEKKMNR